MDPPPEAPAPHPPPPKHHSPSTKAKIQGIIDYCKLKGIEYYKTDVFKACNVSSRTGYRLLNDLSTGARHHDEPVVETRGRKSVVTAEQVAEMERILETTGTAGRVLTWEQLGAEAGIEACGRTIKNAIGTMAYRQCVVCHRGWVSPDMARTRLAYAQKMLLQHPEPEDWDRVRFGHELHFGWAPAPPGKLRLIRKPGQRYCNDCRPHHGGDRGERGDAREPKDEKRFHAWAAVGYDFKSDLHFYHVPGNPNGKMSRKVYLEQILEPVVTPWLVAGQDFVLDEEGEAGHGLGRTNPVQTWKDDHRLKHSFHCLASPDLTPMENCWLPPTAQLRHDPEGEDAAIKSLIGQGWGLVSQKSINDRARSMVDRLEAVVAAGGKMTAY